MSVYKCMPIETQLCKTRSRVRIAREKVMSSCQDTQLVRKFQKRKNQENIVAELNRPEQSHSKKKKKLLHYWCCLYGSSVNQ